MSTINYVKCESFDEALKLHKDITGNEFFECYENLKAGAKNRIDSMRNGNYMVNSETGDIYYIILCPEGLNILNKLTISSCLTDSAFHPVTITDNCIIIDRNVNYARSNAARNILASRKILVTTL